MLLHYLKPSLRNLLKNKVITGINVLGLSIGISAALVIYLIVQYDYSFDRYEAGRDRIYRIVTHGDNWDNAGLPVPAPRSMTGITGIANAAFFMGMNDNGTKITVGQGNAKDQRTFRKQEKFVYTDGNYFSLFPHEWVAGNPNVSLHDPHQLVLSELLVRRYFPGLSADQAIGKTVMIDDSIPAVVSGVVKDLTVNTDFDHEAFLSLATIASSKGLKDQYQWDEWGSTNDMNQLVVRLAPGASSATVQRQVVQVFADHQDKNSDFKTKASLQPLSDIHFNEALEGKVNKQSLFSMSMVALFILLLASINFINLSTAQASERAKEIGMRKILGSSKAGLIGRFLSETILLTIVATIFSLLITPLLMKGFSDFVPKGLDAGHLAQPHVLLFLAVTVIAVSLLSGIYPALVLTHIKPLSVTRNQTLSTSGGNRRVWLRKTLTVSQFVIAQALIIGVLVVNSQVRYAINTDMGFRKDAIVNFFVPFDFAHPDGKKFILRDKLRNISAIQNVSLGNQAPAIGGTMSTILTFKEGKKDIKLDVDSRDGDTNYISLYNIRLIAGRNVRPSDSTGEFLINETLARAIGFQHPADAVGHMFSGNDNKGQPIVGVMADFHLASVRTVIHPVLYRYDSKNGYVMHVALRHNPDTWKSAIAKMQAAWSQVYPDETFDYSFFDKDIAGFYENEQRLSWLMSWAAGVAILISCLGLLGLVIFTANQRTKEIGIRKVLGASVAQIIALLSKDFILLVVLAFVIAVPITWYMARQYLNDFAYATPLNWWLFAIGGVSMLVLALLVLSLRAGKAALSNPVNCLRSE